MVYGFKVQVHGLSVWVHAMLWAMLLYKEGVVSAPIAFRGFGFCTRPQANEEKSITWTEERAP